MKLYMFRTVPLSIVKSFSLYTQQWCMPYRFAVNKPVWHIPLLCVQWKTPDDRPRNCSKHVEFHFKNKFEKLVHLISFIIEIYQDAVTWTSKNVYYCWFIFMLLCIGCVYYVVSLLFASLCYFLITLLLFCNILCIFVFLSCMFVLYFVYTVFLYCSAYLFLLSYMAVSCLFFVQFYQPLLPGETPICSK